MAIRTLFASASLTEHLVRGTVGMGSLVAAYQLMSYPSLAALGAAAVFGIVSMVAMRGCPMCWTMGLFNTSMNKVCPVPKQQKK
jgi:hypothetical protein